MPHRVRFKKDTQVAGAEAHVLIDYDEDEYRKNLAAAESLARLEAEKKYVSEFGEPVDWTLAVVVTRHTEYSVEVYIYVEGM